VIEYLGHTPFTFLGTIAQFYRVSGLQVLGCCHKLLYIILEIIDQVFAFKLFHIPGFIQNYRGYFCKIFACTKIKSAQ